MTGRAAFIWAATFLCVVAPSPRGAPALAHASLTSSQPPDGAIVAAAPEQLLLRWDEPVSSRLSTVQLRDGDGRPVDGLAIRTDRPNPQSLAVDLPSFRPGTYSVLWKAFSEADGHVSRGLVVFGVGEEPRPGTPPVIDAGDRPAALEVAFRALYFFTLLAAIGGSVAGHLILSPSTGEPRSQRDLFRLAQGRALLWVAACCLMAFAAGFGLLAAQLSRLDIGLADAWPLLTESRWARIWAERQGLLLAGAGFGVIVWREARPAAMVEGGEAARRITLALAGLGLSVCLGTTVVLQAASGHAAADGTILPIAADALHILAAGAWAGGLIGLLVALPAARDGRRSQAVAFALNAFRRFSPVAATSVAMLLITGSYAALRQIPNAATLVASPYGGALAMKLLLVVIMGALGLGNFALLHRRLVQRLAARLLRRPWRLPLPTRLIPRLLAVDAIIAVLIVGSVSLLTALPSSKASAGLGLPDREEARSVSAAVDDLVVSLTVKPNQPGQNVFAVLAASTRRPLPAAITRLILRFTYLDEDIGRTSANATELEPGRYILTGSQLGMAGRWRIEVAVRRNGLEDRVARFDWNLDGGPAGGSISVHWIAVLSAVSASAFLLIASPAPPLIRRRRTLAGEGRQPSPMPGLAHTTSGHRS